MTSARSTQAVRGKRILTGILAGIFIMEFPRGCPPNMQREKASSVPLMELSEVFGLSLGVGGHAGRKDEGPWRRRNGRRLDFPFGIVGQDPSHNRTAGLADGEFGVRERLISGESALSITWGGRVGS